MLPFGSLDIYQVSLQVEHEVPLLVLGTNTINVFGFIIGYKLPIHDLLNLDQRLIRP